MRTITHPEVKKFSRGAHLVGLTLLIAIGVVYYFTVSQPILNAVGEDQVNIERLRRLQRSAVPTRREHARLTDAVLDLKRRSEAMRRRIPLQSDEAGFLNDVARLADELGIKVVEYRPGAVLHSDTHSQLDLEIKCVGRYSAICHFVDRMHHLRRITSVKRLAIQPGVNSADYPLHLTLTLYFGIRSTQELVDV